MKNLFRILTLSALALGLLYGQATTTSTTLSAAVVANTTTQWCFTSATNINVPSLASNTVGTYVVVDREAAQIMAAGVSTTCFVVRRGVLGTSSNYAHNTTSTVWVGNVATGNGDTSRPFTGALVQTVPSGTCTASAQYTLPVIFIGPANQNNIFTGQQFRCIGGIWQGGVPQNSNLQLYSAFPTITPAVGVTSNSTTDINGTIWWSQLFIPANTTLTGACLSNGATVGTDKWIFALYDAAGAVIANTATAGTTTATASKYQCINFTATIAVMGPQTYYIAMQGNGTTDNFLTYAAAQAPTNYGTNNQTGTFGTLAAITPTTTFVANKGPIMTVF